MRLTISAKGVLSFTAHDLEEKDLLSIKKHIEWFMRVRKVKNCKFKLEGEAEERKVVQMACLFG